jgi:hypothetical protein
MPMDKENGNGERRVDLVKCLEEIKKDLRHLPCQSKDEKGCLQDDKIQQLEKGVQDSHTAYILCHKEKLEPLIKSNLVLNEKQDLQQRTIDRIEIKVDKIQDKVSKDLDSIQTKMNEDRIVDKDDLKKLELALTKIITQKETATTTKVEIRNVIQWALGIIIASAAVYGIIRGIISIIATNIIN